MLERNVLSSDCDLYLILNNFIVFLYLKCLSLNSIIYNECYLNFSYMYLYSLLTDVWKGSLSFQDSKKYIQEWGNKT